MRRGLWLGVWFMALPGCAAWLHASGGVATSLSGRQQGAQGVLDVEYGGRFGALPVGGSMNLHGRFGAGLVQVAPSLSVRGAVPSTPVAPFLGLGLRVFSLESNQGAFVFGLASPYLDLGTYVIVRSQSAGVGQHGAGGGVGLVLHGQVGYDVRLASEPNDWWASVSLGVATYVFGQ